MSRLIIHYHCYDVMQPVDMEILLFTLLAMLTAVVRLVVEFYFYNAKTKYADGKLFERFDGCNK